jgi:uncharacterized RDD family membrane protein YckC
MRCQTCGQDNPLEARFCIGCGTDLVTREESIALPGEAAGFWIRFAACGVDSFIVISTFLILSYLIHGAKLEKVALDIGWPFLILLLYHWLFTGLKGQTIGKRLFHIKVVGVEDNTLGLGRAFLREVLGKPITVLFTVFYIAVMLAIGGGDLPKRWIHDKIAHSKVVVKERYGAIRTSAAWWLLELLPAIGSIIGLLLLRRKDRRKAWAIFWGGLFMSFLVFPIVILIVMLAAS